MGWGPGVWVQGGTMLVLMMKLKRLLLVQL